MKKKIRNKTKLFGLFVSVLAVGTFAAAMSEHVTSVGANDGTTKLIQTLLKLSSHKLVSQLVSSVKRMTFMLPL